MQTRAIFLDRDGVLNDLVYNKQEGSIGSPFSAKEMRIFSFVPDSIKKIQQLGFRTIIISNQPGVAKRQFAYSEHVKMNSKLERELAKKGCKLDGTYYCLHHPSALIRKYKKNCDCRKPKPGLILEAAKDLDIDLKGSYFVGDSLGDVKAGKAVGCKTVLVGHVTDFLNRMIEKEKTEPDFMIPSLKEMPGLLQAEVYIDTIVNRRNRRSF